MNSAPPRKISNRILFLISCLLGIAIGLFVLNFWHTSNCGTGKSANEIEELVESLNRRLLQSESQALKNEIILNKVVNAMQYNLFKLEEKEFEDLSNQAKNDAVKIALYLAEHPAPPMPEFPLESNFNNAEKLADAIDDVFDNNVEDLESQESSLDDDLTFNDAISKDDPSEKEEVLSDSEALKLCQEWKEKYGVNIGVSWGSLPFELQHKWMKYSCDYHLG